jgi:hypothetical protein
MFPTLFLLLLELYGLFNQSVPKLYDKGALKLLKSIALIGYSRKIWLSQRPLGLPFPRGFSASELCYNDSR